MMFVSEFITDAPSAMPAEASVLPLEPIKVDEVLRRIAVGIVFTIGVGALLTIAAAFAMRQDGSRGRISSLFGRNAPHAKRPNSMKTGRAFLIKAHASNVSSFRS